MFKQKLVLHVKVKKNSYSVQKEKKMSLISASSFNYMYTVISGFSLDRSSRDTLFLLYCVLPNKDLNGIWLQFIFNAGGDLYTLLLFGVKSQHSRPISVGDVRS